MQNRKLYSIFNIPYSSSQHGFTLMELIVVLAIMAVMAGALVVNLNSRRASRDIVLAQNQLVSNIRKIQSYTLSSRAAPNGESVQYYVMKFDLANPNQYSIQLLYNVRSSPQYLMQTETIALPLGITFATSSAISITRSNYPTTQAPASCALLAFSLPFAKTFLNDGCTPSSPPSNPYGLSSGDDYKKIIDYVNNVDCNVDPTSCSVSTDSKMVITLVDSKGTLTRQVLINGITGVVCPTLDGVVCQATY